MVGYKASKNVPREEQIVDELDIKKYMLTGSSRSAAIAIVRELRATQCALERTRSNNYNNYNNNGYNRYGTTIGFNGITIGLP